MFSKWACKSSMVIRDMSPVGGLINMGLCPGSATFCCVILGKWPVLSELPFSSSVNGKNNSSYCIVVPGE